MSGNCLGCCLLGWEGHEAEVGVEDVAAEIDGGCECDGDDVFEHVSGECGLEDIGHGHGDGVGGGEELSAEVEGEVGDDEAVDELADDGGAGGAEPDVPSFGEFLDPGEEDDVAETSDEEGGDGGDVHNSGVSEDVVEGFFFDVVDGVEMVHVERGVDEEEDEEAHGEAEPDDSSGGFFAVVLVDKVGEEEGDGEGEHAAGVLDGVDGLVGPWDGEGESQGDGEEFASGDVGDEE